jgi:hypothetical protein
MAGFIPDSKSQDWCTPTWILDDVRAAFGVTQIDLDPCSNDTSLVNAKTEYKVPANDGLNDSWDFPTIFVNPPFGTSRMRKDRLAFADGAQWKAMPKAERKGYVVTTIKDWLRRCAEAAEKGSQAIALVPVTPETKGWLKYVWPKADGIGFFKKRIKFIDFHTKVECTAVIPKPMCVIYWAGAAGAEGFDRFEEAFSKDCHIVPAGPTREAVRDRLVSLLRENGGLRAEVENLATMKALKLAEKVSALDTRNASVLVFEGEGVRDVTPAVVSALRTRLTQSGLLPKGALVLLMPDTSLSAMSPADLQPIIDRLCKVRDEAPPSKVTLPVLSAEG